MRIMCHNKICAFLADEARRLNWKLHHKPDLRMRDNLLRKPDLILVKNNRALVVDVTVRYEYQRRV